MKAIEHRYGLTFGLEPSGKDKKLKQKNSGTNTYQNFFNKF